MSTDIGGGPAFPVLIVDRPKELTHFNGMTLRDYFAARAMQSYLSGDDRGSFSYDEWARASYQMADAMLKARQQ